MIDVTSQSHIEKIWKFSLFYIGKLLLLITPTNYDLLRACGGLSLPKFTTVGTVAFDLFQIRNRDLTRFSRKKKRIEI